MEFQSVSEESGNKEGRENARLSTVHTLQDSLRDVRCFVYFSKPFCRLISGSYDGELRVYDGETFQLLSNYSSISESTNTQFYDMVSWEDRGIFMTCSGTKSIQEYSILSKHPFIKAGRKIDRSREQNSISNQFYRLLKLTEDLFLATYRFGIGQTTNVRFEVFSCSKMELVRSVFCPVTILRANFGWFSGPCLSKKYENCFFINVDDDAYHILMLDYQSGDTKKQIETRTTCNSLCSFVNDRNEEIVVTGGDTKTILFYSVETCQKIKSIDIEHGIYALATLSSTTKSRNSVCVGDLQGNFHLFDVSVTKPEHDYECFLMKKTNVHWISRIKTISYLSHNSVMLATSSQDGQIQIMKIESEKFQFNVDDEQSKIDLNERIEFLLQEDSLEESSCLGCIKFVSIQLQDRKIEKVMFVLLLTRS